MFLSMGADLDLEGPVVAEASAIVEASVLGPRSG